MRKRVIEVVIKGEVGYLAAEPSIFTPNAVTQHAAKATDYTNDPDKLEKHLDILVLPGDEWFAKSGLKVDYCSVVEIEVKTQELSRRIGRDLHKCVDGKAV